MKIRHSNAYAAIMVLVLVSILFIGMYAMMNPFAKIFTLFTESEDATVYNNQTTCETGGYYWYHSTCYDIPERARTLLFQQRRVWLIAPIIFIIGLIFWYITVAVKKDPFYYNQGPPGGSFQ